MPDTADDDLPLYMSAAHVQDMNARLAGSSAVIQAAAPLPGPVLLVYRLKDEDSGELIWWQMRLSPQRGVEFALGEPASPVDLTFVAGYWDMVAAAQAQRNGKAAVPDVKMEGNVDLLRHVGAAIAQSQSLATVPVRFPIRSSNPGSQPAASR